MYYVYILSSLKKDSYYIGSTADLERRLFEHNRGNTRSLRSKLPVKIIYCESLSSKEEAKKREKQIKSYKGGEAFKKLIQTKSWHGTRVVNG